MSIVEVHASLRRPMVTRRLLIKMGGGLLPAALCQGPWSLPGRGTGRAEGPRGGARMTDGGRC